jgi:cysteine synthase A
MLTSGAQQARNADGSPSAGHPSWNPHPLQGWSPDFIPKLTGDAVAAGHVDRVITVANAEAMQWSRRLAREEGILVGTSSGATFAGAIKLAHDVPRGSAILCMLPDTGERYLSTGLFADVPAEMNDDELAISRSTPTAQLAPA